MGKLNSLIHLSKRQPERINRINKNGDPLVEYHCGNHLCFYKTNKECAIRKHIKWSCKKGDKTCNIGCGKLKNRTMWEHMRAKHASNEIEWKSFGELVLDTDVWHFGALRKKQNVFIYMLKMTTDYFIIHIISDIRTFELSRNSISVKLQNVKTGFFLQHETRISDWTLQHTMFDFTTYVPGSYTDFTTPDRKFKILLEEKTVCEKCVKQIDPPPLNNPAPVILDFACRFCDFRGESRGAAVKHENWFCSRNPDRMKCECGVEDDLTSFEHFISHYELQRFSMKGTKKEISNVNETCGAFVPAYNEFFLFLYKVQSNSIRVSVITTLKPSFLRCFRPEVRIYQKASEFYFHIELNLQSWSDYGTYWDYVFYSDLPVVPQSLISGDNRFSIKFIVKKFCNSCSNMAPSQFK